MSTSAILAMIDGPVIGHTQWAYANYDQYVDGMADPPTVGTVVSDNQDLRNVLGSDDFTRSYSHMEPTVAQLVDGQVLGHSGPSLDSLPTVRYRGDRPGFGDFNDQPMFSGTTNFSPGVVPSEEVGTGKPPGWVQAHMAVAEGINATRFTYAFEGVFADGGEYFPYEDDPASDRLRQPGRDPWWPATLLAPGQSPNARAMWPGSAVIETQPSMSMSEILGRVTGGRVPGWGVQ